MIRSVRPLCVVAALLPASFAFAQQPATKPVAGSQQSATDPTDQTVHGASDAILANMVHTACANHAALAEALPLLTKHRDQAKALHQQCAAAPVDGGGGNR